jgi:uncharacterized protein YjbK
MATEIEIKLDLLREENYSRLLAHLGAEGKEIRQENYFFDTDLLGLGRAGWALRIRIENDNAAATAKGPASENPNGLAVRPETMVPLPIQRATRFISRGLQLQELPPSLREHLYGYVGNDILMPLLQFANLRTTVHYPAEENTLALEIDQTIFADKSINYELEVELADKEEYDRVMAALAALFDKIAIPIVFQKESKLARAMRKNSREQI